MDELPRAWGELHKLLALLLYPIPQFRSILAQRCLDVTSGLAKPPPRDDVRAVTRLVDVRRQSREQFRERAMVR